MKKYIHQIAILSDYSSFVLPPTSETIRQSIAGDYILWREAEIKKIIQNYFDPSVLMAYNMLKPNALKADLARYCILYKFGGWYFDLLITIDGTIGHNLENFDMLVFRDIPLKEKSPLPISNSIIWVKESQNSILKRAIDISVQNILNRAYPKNSHGISGPVVFGKAIAEAALANDLNILVGSLSFENESGNGEFCIESWEHRKRVHFGWFKLPGGESHLPENYQKGSSYEQLFFAKDIYK